MSAWVTRSGGTGAPRRHFLFKIGRKNGHLKIVAALVVLIVYEQHADEFLADIDLGGIILLGPRHDTQLGVAEQALHVGFQLADFLDVHGGPLALAHSASRVSVFQCDRITLYTVMPATVAGINVF